MVFTYTENRKQEEKSGITPASRKGTEWTIEYAFDGDAVTTGAIATGLNGIHSVQITSTLTGSAFCTVSGGTVTLNFASGSDGWLTVKGWTK